MPHIHAIFVDDEITRDVLFSTKTKIRAVFAELSGCDMKDIAFIPSKIAGEDDDLVDNMLPLELVIDSGSQTLDWTEDSPAVLLENLREAVPKLFTLHFGIWVRSHAHNNFFEHIPDDPDCP